MPGEGKICFISPDINSLNCLIIMIMTTIVIVMAVIIIILIMIERCLNVIKPFFACNGDAIFL